MGKYVIVIPTLDRPENMRRMLSMFPKAIVTVNESTAKLFANVVPKEKLVVHPNMRLIETRNWILDHFQEDCVIQFNDDIRSLVSLVPSRGYSKTYRQPDVISMAIQNTMQCAEDLDIGVFCWSLTKNVLMFRPALNPIRLSAPCSAHAFGVRGKSRTRRLDPLFRGCGDVDYTFRTLLEDRVILCDARWHFDCGGMSRGVGGQSGELRVTEAEVAQREIQKRWGHYVGCGASQKKAGKNTWRSFSVNVQRKSPLAIS